MNQYLVSLGLAVWAFVSSFVMWQLPRETYVPGFLAGAFLTVSAVFVAFLSYRAYSKVKQGA